MNSNKLPSQINQSRSNIKVAVRIRPILEDEKAKGLCLDTDKL
jgi:hypothetical protein